MEMNGSLEENNSLDKLMHNSGTLQHLVRWPRACTKLKTKDRTSINFRRGWPWTGWPGGGAPESGNESKMITASRYQDVLRFLTYFDQRQRLASMKSSKVKMKLTNINLEFEIMFQP